MSKSENINSIVLLRAIAALGVCFVHIQMLSAWNVNRLVNYVFNNGQQGVAVFFVISGFILPYSLYKKQYQLKNFFRFLLKRIVRVDPPYWGCIALLFILIPLPLSELTFNNMLLHLTYLVPFIKSAHWYSDIFWTLSIEFQFYIALGLLYPLFMRLPYYVTISIIIVLSVLCMHYTDRGIITGNVYQFAFGYMAFMAYVKLIDRKTFFVVFLLFTLYIVFGKSIISGIVPAATVVFILLYKSNTPVPVFNFLGHISYSLYLVHIPASAFLIRCSGIKSPAVLFFGCLLFSVLLAYIFNLLVEKPALKLSKAIRLE